MNQRYQTLKAEPIAGALGAEISGVTLSDQLADEVVADIRQALLDHLVIFFRDQPLTPPQQINFASRFGDLEEHDFVKGMEDYPQIIRVVREADEQTMNFGGTWHCDVTHQERPALLAGQGPVDQEGPDISQMQGAGHIGWRNDDSERLASFVRFAVKVARRFPSFVQA